MGAGLRGGDPSRYRPVVNRLTPLLTTQDLALARFDHPAHEPHEDPDLEVADRWTIAFVMHGTFELACGGRAVQMRPGSLFVPHPGVHFSCRHHARCPDDVCLSITVAPHAAEPWADAWTRAGWVAREVPTPRLAWTRQRLHRALDQDDPLAREHWALEALGALVADTGPHTARGPYAPRARELDAVVAASEGIDADPARRRSVAGLALEVGLDAPRLQRAFARYAGTSPLAYLISRRLHLATQLLDAGATVSEACYRSGFENLSHFCRSFRRATHGRPSEWAGRPHREKREKVQAILGRAR